MISIIIKTIIFIIVTFMICLFSGYFLRSTFNVKEKNILSDFFVGIIIVLAIFEVQCVVGIYLKISLFSLSIVYALCVGTICFLGIIKMIYRKEKVFSFDKNIRQKSSVCLIFCVCILVGIQAFMISFCMRQNTDDSSYIAITNTALETNTLLEYSQYTGEKISDFWPLFKRSLSPFCLLMAVLSSYTGIHPAIAHHTILPILIIPLAYAVYWELSKIFFIDTMERWYFLLFLCLTNIYGAYSSYSSSVHLLTRIWQGKAIYAAIFIPWLFYCLICVYKNDRSFDWIMLFLSSFAGILLSNVAVIGNSILIFVYALYGFYKKKNWRFLWRALICCIPMLVCGLIMVLCMYMIGLK